MSIVPAAPAAAGQGHRCSPFAGADVCEHAGFALPPGTRPVMFDDDVWDFTQVTGLPVQLPASGRRLDFTAIGTASWRLVGKELMFALLVPRHPAVIVLPRALRTPLHLQTCNGRLRETARLLDWMTGCGIARLQDLREEHCEEYLLHRGRGDAAGDGEDTGGPGPSTRNAVVLTMLDLISYRDLFTADRVQPGLRPWGGRSASAVSGMNTGRHENTTQPVAEEVLQPMLAAALYLTGVLGPHVAGLAGQARMAREAIRQLPKPKLVPARDLLIVLDRHRQEGDPLPRLAGHDIRQRLGSGWRQDDPLLLVSFTQLAVQAGFREFFHHWLPALRPAIEDVAAAVGTRPWWGRTAQHVQAAGGDTELPWTLPLHGLEVIALTEITRTAALVATAGLSGMRAGELMELRTGCRMPVESHGPGRDRYRLASKVVKGQQLGGTADQWVVIEPVFTAIEVAEHLREAPHNGALLFGRFNFGTRYQNFRDWVNGPHGHRLGLDPIPDGPVSLRMLRRTFAITLAYRPGGILASKIHMRHLSVATSEGYAARPGGAQGRLLAEVNRHEQQAKLEVVIAEFRNYQAGIMPAGPGARELTEFFAHVDGTAAAGAPAPKIQRSDRDILNLLSKRAAILHQGTANYCWFADPSRALCLRLAGRPDATAPLIGMCDSARCPQATHHAVHRDVWTGNITSCQVFIGSLGPTRTTEKARLQGDLDRALRVVAGIDSASHADGHDAQEEDPCG
ncbi:MAG TPA: hypothetical protein DHU96_35370 [Actinobacteria bacterium]|nr:hypothetical protein [Actinomycetota bacterium]